MSMRKKYNEYKEQLQNSDSKMKKLTYHMVDWAETIIFAIVVVLLLKVFLVENTLVKGQSMEPTLQNGNYIFLTKPEYFFGNPKKGEVIVFKSTVEGNKMLIKRVIGVPGDEVNLINGKVYINSKKLDEKYFKEEVTIDEMHKGDMSYPLIVPENQYYVLGDNRNNSLDSRISEVGLVHKEKIIGRANLRVWPLNKFGFVK